MSADVSLHVTKDRQSTVHTRGRITTAYQALYDAEEVAWAHIPPSAEPTGVRRGPAVPPGHPSPDPRQQQDDPLGGVLAEVNADLGLQPLLSCGSATQ